MNDFFAMNLGTLDRGIRIALGIALISIATSGPRAAWGYAGFLPLVTGAIGWCPSYAIFRFSTCGGPHRVES